MINLVKPILFVSAFALMFMGSCCSGRSVQQNEDVQTVNQSDSIPVVDSLSYQRGLQHSVEEKLHKSHKEKLKK